MESVPHSSGFRSNEDLPIEQNFNETKSTLKSVHREYETLSKNYYEGLPKVGGSQLNDKRFS